MTRLIRPVADDFETFLGGWLEEEAAGTPDYLDEVRVRVASTRQRPAWASLERWLPMAVIARPALAPRVRTAWILLIVALTLAIAAGAAVVGSRLLHADDPNPFNGGVTFVPTPVLDSTWDATTIPGLSQPAQMDVGPDGNLYVVNAGTSEILVLDPSGAVVRRWGERGAGPGQFNFQLDTQDPANTVGGVVVAADGSVYVADTSNFRVQQFDREGTFVRQWGTYGPGDGQFLLPFDVAVRDDGTVYVADWVRDDIQRFSAEGAYLETIGSHGTADGQLNNTGGIDLDRAGALYNADYENDRVQSWAPDGSFAWSVGRPQDGPVRLSRPNDLAVDSTGDIYVTEAFRMVVLKPDRTLASVWTVPSGPRATEEWLPVAVGDDGGTPEHRGTLYLASPKNGLIYRMSIKDLPPADGLETPAAVVASASPTLAGATPSVAASPSAPAASAPAASAPAMTPGGLAVGSPFAVPFTADQPAGWIVNWQQPPGGVELALKRPGDPIAVQATVRVFVPTNAYADPCHSGDGPMDPPVGPTVDDLTAVLTNLPGVTVTKPVTDITIDGYAGKTFDLRSTLVASDCPDDGAWDPMWTYDNGGTEAFSGPGQNFHQHIAILDVDGTRVLIEAWTFGDTPLALVNDAYHVFESIDFE